MEVILFSISCLEEKHQERVRRDESRQRRKGQRWQEGGDRAAALTEAFVKRHREKKRSVMEGGKVRTEKSKKMC